MKFLDKIEILKKHCRYRRNKTILNSPAYLSLLEYEEEYSLYEWYKIYGSEARTAQAKILNSKKNEIKRIYGSSIFK